MAFHFAQKVLFKHCDPAGIVFYPRYFEMINDTVEAFFDEAMNEPFEDMHRGGRGGVPTAHIETDFKAPSRHGDRLDIALGVTRVGRSSVNLSFLCTCGDEVRFMAKSTLVYINDKGRPQSWTDKLKASLNEVLESE
ncbi:acyl-CoA thioesterase [Rhodobacteraceae bacterium RKSG542]|uniref:acyl-CoA thioesterase n=1 Tax=Pseudovibrio flavus TaxID=2529854 RepID=UPI0012BBEB50|nr:thioesterase family protein [Pseudovibrio flavus]MTI16160.1 acyl-CoA thioesterase [Pseudovibrio flavus]